MISRKKAKANDALKMNSRITVDQSNNNIVASGVGSNSDKKNKYFNVSRNISVNNDNSLSQRVSSDINMSTEYKAAGIGGSVFGRFGG